MKKSFSAIVVALLLLSGGPMAHAAGPDDPGATKEPPQRPIGLPPSPGEVGPLKRNKSGEIVPKNPPAPRTHRFEGREGRHGAAPRRQPVNGAAGPQQKRRTKFVRMPARPLPRLPINLGDTSFIDRLQNPAERAAQARALQAEIDRVMAEEAKKPSAHRATGKVGLTPRETALLHRLQQRHVAVLRAARAQYWAAKPWARPPVYWYVTGPGHRRFVAASLTRFDVTPVDGDLKATIRKLQSLRFAALAADEPTPEDWKIAEALDGVIARLREN